MVNRRKPTKTDIYIKQVLKGRKLNSVGQSYMVTIPIDFIKAFGEEIGGVYWVKFTQGKKPNTLIITPITQAEVDSAITKAADAAREDQNGLQKRRR